MLAIGAPVSCEIYFNGPTSAATELPDFNSIAFTL
jgi:hypothetical protein